MYFGSMIWVLERSKDSFVGEIKKWRWIIRNWILINLSMN